jgi:hypothetical protein
MASDGKCVMSYGASDKQVSRHMWLLMGNVSSHLGLEMGKVYLKKGKVREKS